MVTCGSKVMPPHEVVAQMWLLGTTSDGNALTCERGFKGMPPMLLQACLGQLKIVSAVVFGAYDNVLVRGVWSLPLRKPV